MQDRILTMQIRLASDIDKNRWNSFSSAHPQVSPYHHFAWKTSIENAYGHKCFYLIAENSDKEIVGVLPTVLITHPFIKGKLCSLPFCDTGACLAVDESVEDMLINKARDITMQYNLSAFEYRASQKYIANQDIVEPLSKAHKVRMLMELPGTSEILLASFKSKLRSQINKAVKNGLTAELGRSNILIDEFYDVFSSNMKDLGSPTHSKKWFSEIKDNYMNDMVISIIKHKGIPIGAGIVLFNGHVAAIPWASTKRKFNRLAPNMLLYWSLLKYSVDNGYKTFDFGRSTYEEGTYRFKKQWGAYPLLLKWEVLYNTHRITIPDKYTNTANKSKVRPVLESVWKMLPLSLTIAVGPKIRKYITL